jgi:hypothetical protein
VITGIVTAGFQYSSEDIPPSVEIGKRRNLDDSGLTILIYFWNIAA